MTSCWSRRILVHSERGGLTSLDFRRRSPGRTLFPCQFAFHFETWMDAWPQVDQLGRKPLTVHSKIQIRELFKSMFKLLISLAAASASVCPKWKWMMYQTWQYHLLLMEAAVSVRSRLFSLRPFQCEKQLYKTRGGLGILNLGRIRRDVYLPVARAFR